jgi:hypothetical protein
VGVWVCKPVLCVFVYVGVGLNVGVVVVLCVFVYMRVLTFCLAFHVAALLKGRGG